MDSIHTDTFTLIETHPRTQHNNNKIVVIYTLLFAISRCCCMLMLSLLHAIILKYIKCIYGAYVIYSMIYRHKYVCAYGAGTLFAIHAHTWVCVCPVYFGIQISIPILVHIKLYRNNQRETRWNIHNIQMMIMVIIINKTILKHFNSIFLGDLCWTCCKLM